METSAFQNVSTVENTGPVPGDEVTQLYVSDVYASMTRPVKELAGFAWVHLEPGEKKRLIFSLHTRQLAFLDQDMKWKIEHGEICVEAAAPSEDVRLSGRFRTDGDLWMEGKKREFWAEAANIGRLCPVAASQLQGNRSWQIEETQNGFLL